MIKPSSNEHLKESSPNKTDSMAFVPFWTTPNKAGCRRHANSATNANFRCAFRNPPIIAINRSAWPRHSPQWTCKIDSMYINKDIYRKLLHEVESDQQAFLEIEHQCTDGLIQVIAEVFPLDKLLRRVLIIISDKSDRLYQRILLHAAQIIQSLNYEVLIMPYEDKSNPDPEFQDLVNQCVDSRCQVLQIFPRTLGAYIDFVVTSPDDTNRYPDMVAHILLHSNVPAISMDIPLSWDSELGPGTSIIGIQESMEMDRDSFEELIFSDDNFSETAASEVMSQGYRALNQPQVLVSLGIPKLCARYFVGAFHYLVSPKLQEICLRLSGLDQAPLSSTGVFGEDSQKVLLPSFPLNRNYVLLDSDFKY